jgi:pimeloyl-ACP methyl ester carboxylesterase
MRGRPRRATGDSARQHRHRLAGRLHVDCPVTVVAAKNDPGHPEHVAELWRDRITPATLVRVPSRDEDPQAYTAALEDTVTGSVMAWTRTNSDTRPPYGA